MKKGIIILVLLALTFFGLKSAFAVELNIPDWQRQAMERQLQNDLLRYFPGIPSGALELTNFRDLGNGRFEFTFKFGDKTFRIEMSGLTWDNANRRLTGYHAKIIGPNGGINEYTVSNMQYDAQGRLISFREVGNWNGLEREFTRSGITYDNQGRITGYNQEGIYNGRQYNIQVRNITYDAQGRISGFQQQGVRNGVSFSFTRSNISYVDNQGKTRLHAWSYHQEGTRNGHSYSLDRDQIEYGRYGIVSYHERGTVNGRSYEFYVSNINYTAYQYTDPQGRQHTYYFITNYHKKELVNGSWVEYDVKNIDYTRIDLGNGRWSWQRSQYTIRYTTGSRAGEEIRYSNITYQHYRAQDGKEYIRQTGWTKDEYDRNGTQTSHLVRSGMRYEFRNGQLVMTYALEEGWRLVNGQRVYFRREYRNGKWYTLNLNEEQMREIEKGERNSLIETPERAKEKSETPKEIIIFKNKERAGIPIVPEINGPKENKYLKILNR